MTVESQAYHKSCFKCSHGGCSLSPSNYAALDGILYCKHHFSQLFKEKEAITIWSNLHRWSVKQQPPIWILQRSSHKLPICGFVESIFPLLSSLPQCVLLWSSQFRDGKQKGNLHESPARRVEPNCLFARFMELQTNHLKLGNDLLNFMKAFCNISFWVTRRSKWSHSVSCLIPLCFHVDKYFKWFRKLLSHLDISWKWPKS